ncbi:MAG: aminotransferase class I/II-fold pyridoxal phosphate-dependent enzyme [Cytophagales bacterium]|jgi:7-keto-8-aminopelargonate synthetase-like enzyme|nr:aminotransferase class I/II-fold pyridoxal phosphate-dependent enzyme [Cytophagales bacterium]
MTLIVDELPGRTVRVENETFLYFSGTSYLGVGRNPVFGRHLREGIRRYGTNFSGSRIGNLQLGVYTEAEQRLAAFTGAETALTFSSGFLVGQALIRQLPTDAAWFFAPRTHPALWRNEQDNTDGDFTDWTQQLPAKIARTDAQTVVLLANSLDPLYAEPYCFDWAAQLPADRHYVLVVDDSHGLGIIGANGGGVFAQLPVLPHVETVVTSSLGKALGLPGGVVLGRAERVERLRHSPFFTAGSPMSPAHLYAYLQSAELYENLRKRLTKNVSFFRKQAPAHLFRSFDSYPVFYTADDGLYKRLYKQKILISSFPYPSPLHPHITRVVVSALHTAKDISKLLSEVV